MASSKTSRRRLTFRWTALRGFSAIIIFLIIAIIFEALLIYSFQRLGLEDRNAWSNTFLVPGVNWSFTISISMLFHILPLSTIAVLTTSWTYLTRHTAFVSRGAEPTRRVPAPSRRVEGGRLRALRRSLRRLSRSLQRTGRAIKNGFKKIYGVSYISEHLAFARAAVRSAATVLMIFVAAILLIIIVEYPDLIHAGVVNLYRGNPSYRDFVLGVTQSLQGLGQAVPPLGGLGSAIINGLVGAGPGFRQALHGAGADLTTPIIGLDVAGKYVLSQNFAAWASALVVLLYGYFFASRPSRGSRTR